MRFTLRTILAYLDDTLEPTQTRELGHRINKSESAKALIDRIRTVVRRRRLLAPDVASELAAMDANEVAEYVDNVGPGENLAKTERKILESDMQLAEVAVVHQIAALGLTKLPDPSPRLDSRVATTIARAGVNGLHANRRLIRLAHELESEAAPVEPGVLPLAFPQLTAGRTWQSRLATVALVGALAVALAAAVHWTVSAPAKPTTLLVGVEAQRSMEADLPVKIAADNEKERTPALPETAPKAIERKPQPSDNAAKPAPVKPERAAADPVPATKPAPVPTDFARKVAPPPPNADAAPKPGIDLAKADVSKSPPREEVKSPPAKPPAPTPEPINAPPEGLATARYVSPSGVLFRRTNNASVRLLSASQAEATSESVNDGIRTKDEILLPDGYRGVIELANQARIEFVDRTKLAIPADTAALAGADFACAMSVGKMVVRTADKPLTCKIELQGIVHRIGVTGQAKVSFELRVEEPGLSVDDALKSARLLSIGAYRGEVVVAVENQTGESRVAAGHELLVRPGTPPESRPIDRMPTWVDGNPSLAEAGAAENFAQRLPFGEQAVAALRENLTDPSRDVRRFAIRGLAAIERIDFLAEALRSDHLEVRKDAAVALRQFAGEEPGRLEVVRETLGIDFAPEEVAVMIELIAGYSQPALAERATYEYLIGLLDSRQLGIRELAIFNLREIVGKTLNYDAFANDNQRRRPIESWKRWLAAQTALPPKRPTTK